MEFKNKLQNLRKQHSFTQEDLAEKLFVSRTAISKWETGKGYPNLDSLQAISKLFDISINDLLSNEEMYSATKEEKKNLSMFYSTLIFVAFDIWALFFIFIPLYANYINAGYVSVNLLHYETTTFIKAVYYCLFIGSGILAILELVLYFVKKNSLKTILLFSLIYSICSLMFFIMSNQPYVGCFLLTFIAIKIICYLKLIKK